MKNTKKNFVILSLIIEWNKLLKIIKLRPLPQSKGSTVSQIETLEATNIAEDNYCYIKKIYKNKNNLCHFYY